MFAPLYFLGNSDLVKHWEAAQDVSKHRAGPLQRGKSQGSGVFGMFAVAALGSPSELVATTFHLLRADWVVEFNCIAEYRNLNLNV